MAKALFLGRFQPFHKGHLGILKRLIKKFDVIIGLGGPKRKPVGEDPFSAKERVEMIKSVLKENDIIGVKICNVPDIEDDSHYVKYVEKCVKVKFDLVVSGNPWVYNLFKEAGYKIKKINESFGRIGGISATNIRRKIVDGKKWEHLVPESISKYIKRMNK